MSKINEQKRSFVAELLQQQDSVSMVLDATHKDVIVPEHLKETVQLVLTIGYRLPVPIHDLGLTEYGVHGTLSFSRTPFTCFVPWEALWGLLLEAPPYNIAWEDSIPSVIREAVREQLADVKAAEQEESSAEKPSSPFQVIDGGVKEEKPAASITQRPNLKLVN